MDRVLRLRLLETAGVDIAYQVLSAIEHPVRVHGRWESDRRGSGNRSYIGQRKKVKTTAVICDWYYPLTDIPLKKEVGREYA